MRLICYLPLSVLLRTGFMCQTSRQRTYTCAFRRDKL